LTGIADAVIASHNFRPKGPPMRFLLLSCAAAAAMVAEAEAKPARCFTTDDGYFDCSFRATDSSGSFSLSAPGYPTYLIEVDRPGFAYGYLNLGSRNVPLPGMYVRQRDDAACWANPETNTKICAW
jgi:hypothetical protein